MSVYPPGKRTRLVLAWGPVAEILVVWEFYTDLSPNLSLEGGRNSLFCEQLRNLMNGHVLHGLLLSLCEQMLAIWANCGGFWSTPAELLAPRACLSSAWFTSLSRRPVLGPVNTMVCVYVSADGQRQELCPVGAPLPLLLIFQIGGSALLSGSDWCVYSARCSCQETVLSQPPSLLFNPIPSLLYTARLLTLQVYWSTFSW